MKLKIPLLKSWITQSPSTRSTFTASVPTAGKRIKPDRVKPVNNYRKAPCPTLKYQVEISNFVPAFNDP
jgi:hypothetical protein